MSLVSGYSWLPCLGGIGSVVTDVYFGCGCSDVWVEGVSGGLAKRGGVLNGVVGGVADGVVEAETCHCELCPCYYYSC